MHIEKETSYLGAKEAVESIWLSYLSPGDSTFIAPDGTSDIIVKSNSSGANIFLCGVMTRSSYFKCSEPKKYFGIRFKPGMINLFLNLGKTNDELIQIDHFFYNKNQIEDLMTDPLKNHSQIESLIFETLFKISSEVEYRKKLNLINEYSKVQYGTIQDFADRFGVSRRQFSSNFKKNFGYDPRYYSKIKKFNQFLRLASINRNFSLLDLALECGFYDQSDLNHTVKEISGLTPKQLVSQVYNTDI